MPLVKGITNACEDMIDGTTSDPLRRADRAPPQHSDAHDRRQSSRRRERDPAGRSGQECRDRHPGLLLRTATRLGRGLPHVPGRDREDAAPPDRLHHAGRRRHDRAHAHRQAARGAERRARHVALESPARLPGLRQGRRVPVAGHDLQLRPRRQQILRAEAHLPEADPALAADRARPRALHHVLPLRPFPARDRRRRGADGDRSWLAQRDRRDPRARLRFALLR